MLIPITFNDFTVVVDGYETYNIGSVSDKGVKFTVSQAKNLKNEPIDLKKMVSNLSTPSSPVLEIRYYSLDYYKAVDFFQMSMKFTAFYKYAEYNDRLYTMIIEFPYSQEETIRTIKDSFFESLTIEG